MLKHAMGFGAARAAVVGGRGAREPGGWNSHNGRLGTLYPSYSPIVIGFLVFSSIYGLVKTRDDPNSAVGK